jgi:hypothetical protein
MSRGLAGSRPVVPRVRIASLSRPSFEQAHRGEKILARKNYLLDHMGAEPTSHNFGSYHHPDSDSGSHLGEARIAAINTQPTGH